MADFLEMIHFSRGLTLDSENLFFFPPPSQTFHVIFRCSLMKSAAAF